MHRSTLSAGILGLVLLLAPPVAAADLANLPDSGNSETVNLSFAWPDDLRAKVTLRTNKSRAMDGRSEEIILSGSYELGTSRVSDGLLVSVDNVEFRIEGIDNPDPKQVRMQETLLRAVSTPPSYVINTVGRFVRLDGMDLFRKGLLDGLKATLADFPEAARQNASRILTSTLSEQGLTQQVISGWNRDVGGWQSATLTQGGYYRTDFTASFPVLANVDVPMVTTFRFLGRVPCKPGKKALECVELELKTFINPETFAAAIETFAKKFESGKAPVVESLELDTTVRLITEPDTLLPHRMESRKVTSMAVSHGSRTQNTRQSENILMMYTY